MAVVAATDLLLTVLVEVLLFGLCANHASLQSGPPCWLDSEPKRWPPCIAALAGGAVVADVWVLEARPATDVCNRGVVIMIDPH